MSLLINKFYYLPKELLNIILAYSDVIIYRNGKYMNRLLNTDERFKLYETIPKKDIYKINSFIDTKTYISVYFYYKNPVSDVHGFIYKYIYNEDINRMNVIVSKLLNINIIIHKFPIYSHIEQSKYVIDHDSKWRKLVNYTM